MLEVPEAPEVMHCTLLGLLEVEGVGGDAPCAALYVGGCGG